MKKLILLSSLILLTYTSFCQTVTKTAPKPNSDTLVVLPKQLVVYMIKDLVEGDGAKKQLVVQDSLLSEKNKQITAKDSIVSVYRKKDVAYQSTFSEYATIDSLNQRTIQSLNLKISKYKRQRNAFRVFVGVLLIGLAIK